MKNIKCLSVGTMVYMFIFLANYMYELFRIHSSGTVETILGLKIVTEMTGSEINTVFSLTLKAVLMYVGFILIWLLICRVLNSRNK